MEKRRTEQFEPLMHAKGWCFISANGFTLLEAVITLAILGLIAIIGGPTVKSMLNGLQVKSTAQQLFSDIQNAKLKAIHQNMNVVLQFDTAVVPCSTDGLNSSAACPNGQSCYRIFLDANGNTQCDNGDTILSDVVLDPDYSLTTPAPATPATNAFVAGDGFTSRGLPINASSRTVQVANVNSSATYVITVAPAGSVTIQ